MNRSRLYPDEPAGPFPPPPATFDDYERRRIELRPVDGIDDDTFEALVDMYVAFDPEDRAQGIPPTGETRVREWLETIGPNGIHVAAWDGDEIVGHTVLVPAVDDPASIDDRSAVEWELAIFVLQSHQRAGIGTQLLEHLLGYASELGLERVWLTVERWNAPAIALYKSVGFAICGSESFEQEMAIRLE